MEETVYIDHISFVADQQERNDCAENAGKECSDRRTRLLEPQ